MERNIRPVYCLGQEECVLGQEECVLGQAECVLGQGNMSSWPRSMSSWPRTTDHPDGLRQSNSDSIWSKNTLRPPGTRF